MTGTLYNVWRFYGLLEGQYQAGDHNWHDTARVTLDGKVGGLDTTRRTHIATLWVRSGSVRFNSFVMFGTATYSPGRFLIQSYVRLVVNCGTQIHTVITHGCKNLEEKKEKVASGQDQEIHGGVLEYLVKNVRRTTNTGKTSTMTSRGRYNYKQSQGVFDAEVIGCLRMDGGKEKERTVHQRKYKIYHLSVCLHLGGASPRLVERKAGEYGHF